jgi:hypothetical protein
MRLTDRIFVTSTMLFLHRVETQGGADGLFSSVIRSCMPRLSVGLLRAK